MNSKLTYKIQNILLQNEYTEITIKDVIKNEEINIKNASIKLRYEPETDKGYLSFDDFKDSSLCEIGDDCIKEVILNNDSLSLKTNEKIYSFYKNKDKMYF